MSNKVEESSITIDSGIVECYYHFSVERIKAHYPNERLIFITDENVYKSHAEIFPVGDTIIFPAGEENKNLETVGRVIDELHEIDAGRNDRIIGVGGGVVTDLSGFVASIYLRGLKFSFAPTSVLAMVDAAIGGKNGVDSGQIKNQIGVIRQPDALLFDFTLLRSLPPEEWVSGFGEIIKHACIKDAEMFHYLENHRLEDLGNNPGAFARLVQKNVNIKLNVVAQDELETNARRILNFGHTLAHAIETLNKLPHGLAVSVGIVFACKVSERLTGFDPKKTEKIVDLLQQYHLPVSAGFDKEAAWNLVSFDKKKSGDSIYFVVLEDIGKGVIKKISLENLKDLFFEI